MVEPDKVLPVKGGGGEKGGREGGERRGEGVSFLGMGCFLDLFYEFNKVK